MGEHLSLQVPFGAQHGPREGIKNVLIFLAKKGAPGAAAKEQNMRNVLDKIVLGTIALGVLWHPLGLIHFLARPPWDGRNSTDSTDRTDGPDRTGRTGRTGQDGRAGRDRTYGKWSFTLFFFIFLKPFKTL